MPCHLALRASSEYSGSTLESTLGAKLRRRFYKRRRRIRRPIPDQRPALCRIRRRRLSRSDSAADTGAVRGHAEMAQRIAVIERVDVRNLRVGDDGRRPSEAWGSVEDPRAEE